MRARHVLMDQTDKSIGEIAAFAAETNALIDSILSPKPAPNIFDVLNAVQSVSGAIEDGADIPEILDLQDSFDFSGLIGSIVAPPPAPDVTDLVALIHEFQDGDAPVQREAGVVAGEILRRAEIREDGPERPDLADRLPEDGVFDFG